MDAVHVAHDVTMIGMKRPGHHHHHGMDILGEICGPNDIQTVEPGLFDGFTRGTTMHQRLTNNAGGHYNHTLFWKSMSPPGDRKPGERLSSAIEKSFGGLEEFQTRFQEAGGSLFGSGWVWLVWNSAGWGRSFQDNSERSASRPLQQPRVSEKRSLSNLQGST